MGNGFETHSSSKSSSTRGSSDSVPELGEKIKLGSPAWQTKVNRSDWKKQDNGKWSQGQHQTVLDSASEFDQLRTLPSKYANEQSDATDFRGSAKLNNTTMESLRRGAGAKLEGDPDRIDRLNFAKAVYGSGPKLDEDRHVSAVTTRYMGASEQSDHEVDIVGGKMVGKDGKNLDTTKATGFGGNGAKLDASGRHIFAMNKTGSIRTGDAWAEGRMYNHSSDSGAELAYLNHSSLLGGKKAAGAGEMRVEDGQVKVVSDNSGHYTPDSEMMHQTVGHLEDQGVGLEGMTTEFVGKGGTNEENMGLANAGNNFTKGKLQAGALEMMSYGGDSSAESKMRQARFGRMGLMDSIRNFSKDGLKKTETNDRSGANLGRDVEEQPQSTAHDDEPAYNNSVDFMAESPQQEAPHESAHDDEPAYNTSLEFMAESPTPSPSPRRQRGAGIMDRIAMLKKAGLELDT